MSKPNADAERSREFSFSSEAPVDRWYGTEILDHKAASIRMDFMRSGRAPFLLHHDRERPIGVITEAKVGRDKTGRGSVRFGSNPDAAATLADVDDGILSNTSVGYYIHEMVLERTGDEGDVYRITDWEPFEASLVSVPADPSVGIGRADGEGGEGLEVTTIQTAIPAERTKAMTATAANATAGESADKGTVIPVKVDADMDPVAGERKRKNAILTLCRANGIDERIARRWIADGMTLDAFGDKLVEVLAERSRDAPRSDAFLDMSKGDAKRYSLMAALRAAVNKDWTHAGIELEASRAISNKLSKLPRSATAFFVPLDVLMRSMGAAQEQMRGMTVAGVSGSNYLVSTENMPGSFIDLLRNTSVALRMGVTRLAGLQGNVTIPKMTAGATAYWLADEATQITTSQPTLGQLALSPKNVAALTELSHQLMQQSSPDAEQLVLSSIARDIGLAVDVGILRGSGSGGQPTGIVTTGSIGAFTGTGLASPGVLDAQSDVAGANALNPGCGYVTTPAVAALLMQRPELPSTGTERLWKGNMLQGTVFDFPAMSSAQMAAATALFGWWPSVILAEWGVLELMVNPFSDFTRGLTAVRGWYTCDVGVRYAGAWSYSSSIT